MTDDPRRSFRSNEDYTSVMMQVRERLASIHERDVRQDEIIDEIRDTTKRLASDVRELREESSGHRAVGEMKRWGLPLLFSIFVTLISATVWMISRSR